MTRVVSGVRLRHNPAVDSALSNCNMGKMQSVREYYGDCYTSRFHAEVVEVSPDGRRAYLDRTYFYPTSGGQPHDLGTIGGVPVEAVIEEEDRIVHVLSAVAEPPPVQAEPVECRLDWRRRYDHMQQHTGQHLLSAVFVELFGFKTLSFHMGVEASTIELATGKLDNSQIEAAERRAQELVWEARTVRISFEKAEEAEGLRKASARTGLLRIITIESYDRSACGGTHVRNTAEIGAIQIRNLERIRGNVRLEFVCGGRALARSKQDFRLLLRLSQANSVPLERLEEHVATLRGRLEASDKALTKANQLLAQAEAARLFRETAASSDGLRRVCLSTGELTDEHRAIAIAFAALPQAVLLYEPATIPGTALLVCSQDSGLHAGAAWKSAFAAGGGRGGGSASMAQGVLEDADALQRLKCVAGFGPIATGGETTSGTFAPGEV